MRQTHQIKLDQERLLQIVASHLGLPGIVSANRVYRTTGKTDQSWDTIIARGMPIASLKSRRKLGYIEVKVWLLPEDYLLYDGKRSRKSCDMHVNVSPYGEIIQGKARGRKRSNINPRMVYCRLDHKWYLATKRLVDLTRGASANAFYKMGIQTFVCKGLVRKHLSDPHIVCLPSNDGWKICHPNGERICDWDEPNETEAWIRAYRELIPTVSFFELGLRKYPL